MKNKFLQKIEGEPALFLKKKKLIAATICKNEIDHIDEHLEILEAFDASYILDTGSEDGTAQRLQDLRSPKIKTFKESFKQVHFAQFRNKLLEKIPADYDAIFWIDVDERIPGLSLELILQLKKEIFIDQPEQLCFNVQRLEQEGKFITPLKRVFKAGKGQWQKALHEGFFFENSEDNRKLGNIKSLHLQHLTPNEPKQQAKQELYKKMILDNFKEDPESYLYFLMESHMIQKDFQSVVLAYEDYQNLVQKQPDELKFLIYKFVLISQSVLGHPIDADLINKLLERPNRSIYFYLMKYLTCHRGQKYTHLARLFAKAYDETDPEENKELCYHKEAYTPEIIDELKTRIFAPGS